MIFNLLEAFVVEGWGEDTYEEILDRCPLHTQEPFVGPGTYPDADLFTIAGQTAAQLGLSLSDALRAFGHFAFARLATIYPSLVAPLRDPRTLLLRVDAVIHTEVSKLLPDSVPPRFTHVLEDDGAVLLRYDSKRKLCALLEGLLLGVADHYDHIVRYEHLVCMHDGADHCQLRVRFEPAAGERAA